MQNQVKYVDQLSFQRFYLKIRKRAANWIIDSLLFV